MSGRQTYIQCFASLGTPVDRRIGSRMYALDKEDTRALRRICRVERYREIGEIRKRVTGSLKERSKDRE